jgi:hypothetical protein
LIRFFCEWGLPLDLQLIPQVGGAGQDQLAFNKLGIHRHFPTLLRLDAVVHQMAGAGYF